MNDIRLYKKLYYCILAIIYPSRFIEEEKKENYHGNGDKQVERIHIVRKALGISFLWILIMSGLGALVTILFHKILDAYIIVFQICGAILLLWGTLFVRGWEIQSWGGTTLSEKVNQWLYWILHCIGTSLIVVSLVLSLLK